MLFYYQLIGFIRANKIAIATISLIKCSDLRSAMLCHWLGHLILDSASVKSLPQLSFASAQLRILDSVNCVIDHLIMRCRPDLLASNWRAFNFEWKAQIPCQLFPECTRCEFIFRCWAASKFMFKTLKSIRIKIISMSMGSFLFVHSVESVLLWCHYPFKVNGNFKNTFCTRCSQDLQLTK